MVRVTGAGEGNFGVKQLPVITARLIDPIKIRKAGSEERVAFCQPESMQDEEKDAEPFLYSAALPIRPLQLRSLSATSTYL